MKIPKNIRLLESRIFLIDSLNAFLISKSR